MERKMEIVKSLGRGSYGFVDLVKFTETDGGIQYCAMKSSRTWACDELRKEVRVLSTLRGCPGIVHCYSNLLKENQNSKGENMLGMFLEYAEEGTLKSFMDKHTGRKLPDLMIRRFTRMLLEGLAQIHNKGFVHCDLKPENILVFPRYVCEDGIYSLSYEVKISDFGLAKEHGEKRHDWWDPALPFRGTPVYMSPESVYKGKIRPCLDIWSLGCVVLEMYTGRKAWPDEDIEEIRVALGCVRKPVVPEYLSLYTRHFLGMCFEGNYKKREGALNLLRHPFFGRKGYEPERFMSDDVDAEIRTTDEEIDDNLPQEIKTRPLRLKIIPPKPKNRPLRVKIIPPKPKNRRH